eukprot:6937829-Pyramimonas_sp.AAC.1
MQTLHFWPSVEPPMGPRNAVLGGGRTRTPPVEPSVEFPVGPRNAALGEGDAREHRHWDLRWSSPWGNEA